MSEPVRQRYGLATGKGLEPAPNPRPNPGFRKGGKVSTKQPSKPRAFQRGR